MPSEAFCSCFVVDQFLDDWAIDIVGSIPESQLSGLFIQHDPVRLDVVEAVQHQL